MVRRKRQREADRLAVEADKRRRSTFMREQAERNRDNTKATQAGESVKVVSAGVPLSEPMPSWPKVPQP